MNCKWRNSLINFQNWAVTGAEQGSFLPRSTLTRHLSLSLKIQFNRFALYISFFFGQQVSVLHSFLLRAICMERKKTYIKRARITIKASRNIVTQGVLCEFEAKYIKRLHYVINFIQSSGVSFSCRFLGQSQLVGIGEKAARSDRLFMCLALSVTRLFEFVIWYLAFFVRYSLHSASRRYPWNRI